MLGGAYRKRRRRGTPYATFGKGGRVWRLPQSRGVCLFLLDDNPGADRILLLEAGLRPVAHAGREDRPQTRPLRRREADGVIGLAEGPGLALDDVGGDVRTGDLARERVRRVQLMTGRRRVARLRLGNEGRDCVACVAPLL